MQKNGNSLREPLMGPKGTETVPLKQICSYSNFQITRLIIFYTTFFIQLLNIMFLPASSIEYDKSMAGPLSAILSQVVFTYISP
jgi:hypothetical protein